MSLARVPPVAVLDSSVLVPLWSRVVLQRLAARPDMLFVPVWSEWIIAETWRILAWRWLTRPGADLAALTRAANAMLRYLLPVMRLVSLREYRGPGPWPDLADMDDTPIWQTAIVSGASYVVSHNLADFPPLHEGRHAYAGVEYLTVVELVTDVLGEDPVDLYGAPLPPRAVIRSRRGP